MGQLKPGATLTYETIDGVVWSTDADTGERAIVGGTPDGYNRAITDLQTSDNTVKINND